WEAHRTGRLKIMALMGTEHHKALLGVRTLRESGIDGIEIDGWFGCFAPAGIAAPIADLIAGAFADALRSEAGIRLCDRYGLTPRLRSPEACHALIAADRALFAEIIRLGRLRRA